MSRVGIPHFPRFYTEKGLLMISKTLYDDLRNEHELAYFRGSLAVSYPDSYSLDEKQRISEDMDKSTAEIDAFMRREFQSMPPGLQVRILDLLTARGSQSREWWERILLDFDSIPDSPPAA